MATVQEETLQSQFANGLDLVAFVNEATWKDILLELVKKNQLDPWDIDLIEVVDKYIEVVKGMRVLDLRVPANIILAAAILLKYKSEMLRFEEDVVEVDEAGMPRPHVDVGELTVRLRLPPRRRVSLNELITALEEAMKIKESREAKAFAAPVEIPIKINNIDVEADIERLYQFVKGAVDKSNMTTLSSLIRDFESRDALLGLFIPLLFLANRKKVSLIQERFFEEIIIALNN